VRLSIVVPVLDEARHLPALLAELAHGCPGVQVVVVDGGSRDGSAEIAARAPGIDVVSSEPGRARQMNAGAAVASGDVVLFLHADTRLPRGAADAVLHALADPAVAYGRFDVRFDEPGPMFRLIAALMNLRSRATGICTGDQAIFVRRASFARVGGYPEIALMEDIELTRRLRRAGRLAPLELRVTTSARRWKRDGVVRTVALMWTLRLLHLCGVGPDRLHRWYYGAPGGGPSSERPGSGPVVFQGASTSLAPPAPPGHPLDTAPQEDRWHREQDGEQEGRSEPAIGVGTEQTDRGLLNDEPDQHRAGPEQRSTPHGPPASLSHGCSDIGVSTVGRPPRSCKRAVTWVGGTGGRSGGRSGP
jgi:rSAM/selenodomain-associated transferase 2